VPLHFTAFHPDYKMTEIERTPAATLTRARHIALAAGLSYVYTGNVHDRAGGTTSCPDCGKAVVERDWHEILSYDLTDDGRCRHCAAPIPGRYAAFEGQWGRRRVPVRVSVEPAVRQPRAGAAAGGRSA
jgi:pyruvate formate lyase activating enzyme